MASSLKVGAVFGLVLFSACSAPPAPRPVTVAVQMHHSCASATSLIASNESLIAAHRYAQASRNAESAARSELACRDRWRAANELIVAAELAHQQGDLPRARSLVHEGFALMRAMRPDKDANPVSSALLAQQLSSAQRDLRGEWTFW